MKFRQLQSISKPHFYALTINNFFPKLLRNYLRYISALVAIASLALSFSSMPLYFGFADGLFFLCILIYLLLSFLEFFYRSLIGEGVDSRIEEGILVNNYHIDFALSELLFNTDEIDATSALFNSKIGQKIMRRLGISKDEVKNFVYLNRTPLVASFLNFEEETVDLCGYASVLYDSDKSLATFLSQNSINKEEFIGAVRFVMELDGKTRRKDRFWSKENLGTIPSIGTSWSYGVPTHLGRFGIPFEQSINLSILDVENAYRQKELNMLEGILERSNEANAIIIDDDEGVARDIVGRLVKRIELGVSLPSIKHKNIIELDWNALVATFKEKGALENEILKLLSQAVSAGNVIIYLKDLSGFVGSVKNIGTNLPSLIADYLSSRALQIIASTTNTDFHYFIETNPTLLEKFERIIPESIGVEASMAPLLERVPLTEDDYKIVISYSSILAIVNAADRYITYGEMPQKALDMLVEIAPWAVERKIQILKEDDVSLFVSEKTGIAGGPIKAKETERIEHLEETLHKRVVGQDEAVLSIASAVRRSRSGVGNPKRPLSSFLFIGPTGVGKTEVSKALAESFFGDESKMVRFDMSEYNGPEALSRLIGDFALNKTGLLASKLRDNPYTVLLLDEFEKAAPDVQDLFLQILDEGIFTDALGKQVGCRNIIIIATSNAGSSLIWETVKSGNNLSESKDMIIDQIIKEKVFRPELINRFDGVILFHPLLGTELESVAKIALSKLQERLREKDIELVINSDVVNFLVEKGSDPEFGGRSVNRAVQNIIEDIVAKKIISGEVKAGSKLEITQSDLSTHLPS